MIDQETFTEVESAIAEIELDALFDTVAPVEMVAGVVIGRRC